MDWLNVVVAVGTLVAAFATVAAVRVVFRSSKKAGLAARLALQFQVDQARQSQARDVSMRLRDAIQREPACNRTLARSVGTRSALIAEHPDHNTFTALAESLAGLASMQLASHPADALALAHEAARLFDWRTNDTRPGNLLPAARSLATVLMTVADVLDANGHRDQARVRRDEAAELL